MRIVKRSVQAAGLCPVLFGLMLLWPSSAHSQTDEPDSIRILGVFYTPGKISRTGDAEATKTVATVVFAVSASLSGRTIGIKLNEHGGFRLDSGGTASDGSNLDYDPPSGVQLVRVTSSDRLQLAEFQLTAKPEGGAGSIRHHGAVASVSSGVQNLVVLPEDERTVAIEPLKVTIHESQ